MLPPRDHAAVGVKFTVIVQLPPTTTATAVQLLTWEKAPVAITLLTVKLAVPVLLSVTGTAVLVDPTNTPLKLTLAGESVATGAIPVPLIGTLCGLPLALSVTFTVDDRLPVFVGLNVTVIVQLAFAAKEGGQVFVSAKSTVLAVDILMLVTDNVAVPEFVSVTICGALPTPTCWLPKLTLAGDKLTTA